MFLTGDLSGHRVLQVADSFRSQTPSCRRLLQQIPALSAAAHQPPPPTSFPPPKKPTATTAAPTIEVMLLRITKLILSPHRHRPTTAHPSKSSAAPRAAPGSKNKPKPPVIITRDSPQPTMNPYVLELPAGVDVVESTTHFCRKRNTGLCVLNGNGVVANVTSSNPPPPPAPPSRFTVVSIFYRSPPLFCRGTVVWLQETGSSVYRWRALRGRWWVGLWLDLCYQLGLFISSLPPLIIPHFTGCSKWIMIRIRRPEMADIVLGRQPPAKVIALPRRSLVGFPCIAISLRM
ncbi:UNVERIFIED_CONTAM: AT-hook motif nuclear-localized protein 19 [Sesamum latifolium]|uniref:AT-hook motif nuclear-localized protein 19 n=1 Tax=Sesamum latifolium TaxID=2727402 RepID=A0AAW2WFA8_9LAMI